MSPVKIARVDTAADVTTSSSTPALLRHLHMLRDSLFPFLTPPEFIALLWTCPTLRNDEEIERRAFVATPHAACFFHGCWTDWCAALPPVDSLDVHRCNQEQAIGEIMRVWETELGSTEKCVSLLSLAWLMESELGSLLYSSTSPSNTPFRIVPFILPLSRLDELAKADRLTTLACHFENMNGGENGSEVGCDLCDSVMSTYSKIEALHARYAAEREVFMQEMRDEGVESDSDEWIDRMEEYNENMAETDDLFDEDNFHDHSQEIITGMYNHGGHTRSPLIEKRLKLVEEVQDSYLYPAVSRSFYSPDDGFCKHQLRPIQAFFRRNGFGRLHCVKLPTYNLYRRRVITIEMVGAVAPHGFFAGVYYVEGWLTSFW